jgi:hypothetical protein
MEARSREAAAEYGRYPSFRESLVSRLTASVNKFQPITLAKADNLPTQKLTIPIVLLRRLISVLLPSHFR